MKKPKRGWSLNIKIVTFFCCQFWPLIWSRFMFNYYEGIYIYIYIIISKTFIEQEFEIHVKDEKFILKMHTLIKRIDKYDISYVPPKLYEGNVVLLFFRNNTSTKR